MGTMGTGSKCDKDKDYSLEEVALIACGYDLDLLEEIARHGTEKSKDNLVHVACLMNWGCDDSWSDSGNALLEKVGAEYISGDYGDWLWRGESLGRRFGG